MQNSIKKSTSKQVTLIICSMAKNTNKKYRVYLWKKCVRNFIGIFRRSNHHCQVTHISFEHVYECGEREILIKCGQQMTYICQISSKCFEANGIINVCTKNVSLQLKNVRIRLAKTSSAASAAAVAIVE